MDPISAASLAGSLFGGGGAGMPGGFSGSDSSSGDLSTGLNVGGIVGSPLRPRSWLDELPALIVAGAVALLVVRWIKKKG